MSCVQYVSLRSNELMINERVKKHNGLGELGLKRVETIADGHCLLWLRSYAQSLSKKIYVKKHSQELVGNNDYHKEFTRSKTIPRSVNEFINLKKCSEDDTDLLLYAVFNATKTNVISYEFPRNEFQTKC